MVVPAAAGATAGLALTVMIFGSARSKRMGTSRVTPLTVAVTRPEVIVRGLCRATERWVVTARCARGALEARPPTPPPPGLAGTMVRAVAATVTWREPVGSEGE